MSDCASGILQDEISKRTRLRRGREFKSNGPIRSRRPDGEAPHSRCYVPGKELPAPTFFDARDPAAPMRLEEVTDRVVCGDAVSVLRRLPEEWCPCAVTSPPYWNTVDYGIPGQIGVSGYDRYLADLDALWSEVARALIPNGKLCLNVPIMPLTKAVSGPVFGKTHTRVLLDLYSDMKARIEAGRPCGSTASTSGRSRRRRRCSARTRSRRICTSATTSSSSRCS